MQHVRWTSRPRLRRPTVIAAFEGWNDAGDGASSAVAYLASAIGARPFATIDPEEFYDFTEVRPTVRLLDGVTRSIEWPEPTFSAGTLPGGTDVILLSAHEPQLRWRTFCRQIIEVVQSLDATLVLTLGALLGEVPHTRPVRVIGTSGDERLIDRFHLARSRYEGPTGITGVLNSACSEAGLAAASLWATVPHYISRAPSPKATLALVQRVAELLEVKLPVVDLEIAASAYERQVNDMVAQEDEVAEYVRRLEEDDEGDDDELDEPVSEADLPSGDELASDIERFLRNQRGD